MKISTCFSFSMLCIPAANAWQEFGRRTYTYEKPILKRKQLVYGLVEEPVNKVRVEQDFNLGILRQLEEVLDSDVEVMSFSMSMSFSYDGSSPSSSTAVPTLPPSSSSMPSDMPSLVPSSGPSTTTTSEPTNAPTITPAPTVSSAPSSSAEPTGAPSSPIDSNTPFPTVFDNQIFQCDGNNGVVALGAPSDSTVSVFLTVGYLVESTSSDTDDFVENLENALFGTALLAALDCQDNTLNRRLSGNRRKLLADTTIVGTCDPEIPQAVSCHYMETDLVFWVNNNDDEMIIDTDKAAYAGYMAIQENMENGSFLVLLPTIVRLEYLSPLPLFVPPAANGDGDSNNSGTTPPFLVSSRDSGSNNVSPWTIGACVATITGGLVSMVVWSRNRQHRRQHVQLLEEVEQEDSIYHRGASRNAVVI